MGGGGAASERGRARELARRACAIVALAVSCTSGGGSSGDGQGQPCGLEGGSARGNGPAAGPLDVDLESAFADIAFDGGAVRLVQHPTDDDRWYAAEQGGEIHTFLASDPLGTDAVAVDVNDFVANLGSGNEQGLLGMAFDPDFDGMSGGELYVVYTDHAAGSVVLARYESSDGGLSFAPAAADVVLEIPHPQDNHNGGDVHFGADDLLYMSIGDGGGADDPSDNGQDTTTLLGSVLRLDVRSTPSPGRGYVAPSGNPFFGNPLCDTGVSQVALACPEIYAYGLRNPWRMGFDSLTGDLWLGDVGQSAREEVDFVGAGCNYGWDCREGDLAHTTMAACGGPFVEPEAVYVNGAGSHAVSGGVVYHGAGIPNLPGHYLYADFYTGEIWALDTASMSAPVLLIPSGFNISSFAEARDGEVYAVTYNDPSIYRLVPAP